MFFLFRSLTVRVGNTNILHAYLSLFLKILFFQFKSEYLGYVTDHLAYDLHSLVGEVGGTMGMFLGASFLSLVEIVVAAVRKMMPTSSK